jgi:hypothetical protein
MTLGMNNVNLERKKERGGRTFWMLQKRRLLLLRVFQSNIASVNSCQQRTPVSDCIAKPLLTL